MPCAVVIDRGFLDGRLAESTIDWFAQDGARHGLVLRRGDREVDRQGHVTSTRGLVARRHATAPGRESSCRAPARRAVASRRSTIPGHAEDHFKVVSRTATIAVRSGPSTRRALMTEEWTPLEPGVRDAKWYVKGIGQVKEATVKGGDERAELVSFRRR